MFAVLIVIAASNHGAASQGENAFGDVVGWPVTNTILSVFRTFNGLNLEELRT